MSETQHRMSETSMGSQRTRYGATHSAQFKMISWEHKQLEFVMQLCKKQNVHVRHEYAPIIPKCGIMLLLRNVPWRRP